MNLSNSTPSLVTHDPFRATTSSNLGREESKGECFIQLTLKPAATGSPSSPPLINMLIFYYLRTVTLSKVSRGKLGQTSALHPIPARPSKADDVYCPVVLAPAPVNIAVSEILKFSNRFLFHLIGTSSNKFALSRFHSILQLLACMSQGGIVAVRRCLVDKLDRTINYLLRSSCK